MGLSGLSATSTKGNVSFTIDCSFELSGLIANAILGDPGHIITEILPAQSVTTTLGSLTVTPETKTGTLSQLYATSTVGALGVSSNPLVQPTGLSATSTLGSVVIETKYPLPALSATSEVGTLTVSTFASTTLPGLSLTSTLNDSKIILKYWNDRTPKVASSWTNKTPKVATSWTDKTPQ